MITVSEVEKLALGLSESDRLVVASHLLQSVPFVLADEDEGISEALARDREMDEDPSASLSLEEFEAKMPTPGMGRISE